MKKTVFFIFLLLTSAFAKEVVSVSISPQQFLVEKIAKDLVDILVMVEPSSNHETYEPKPTQMIMLSKSKIYFGIGLPFENIWIERFKKASPNMLVVKTDKNIKKIHMKSHHHDHNDHDLDENHNVDDKDEIFDPHIWLEPVLLKEQAKIIAASLSIMFPDNKEFFNKNLNDLILELDNLDASINDKFKSLNNRDFLVFHPSWGYFAKRYNLNQIPIEIEGKEPKPAELVRLSKYIKENNIKVLFTEPQISQKNANVIAKEIDAKIVQLDPLKKDVIENLKFVSDEILKAQK